MRESSIMMNWSAYFFPWAERDALARVIEDLNEDHNDKISFNIIKFDDAEEDKLAQMVVDGIRKVLSSAHKSMVKRLSDANEAIEKGESQLIDLKQSIGHSHREAKKAIKEATALAMRFEQTSNLEDAIATYVKIIEALAAEKHELYAEMAKSENEKFSVKAMSGIS